MIYVVVVSFVAGVVGGWALCKHRLTLKADALGKAESFRAIVKSKL